MTRWMLAWAVAGIAATSPRLGAQVTTGTVVPDASYRVAGIWHFLLGSNWRDLWIEPVRAPVLDLATFGGGLSPIKAAGNQTATLHLRGADGRMYIFRSTAKSVTTSVTPEFRGTVVAAMIDDQHSAIHPTGPIVASALEDRLHLLHAPPTLVIMPDDPRLGEFRERFAGALGEIEERPDNGGNDAPVSFGAIAIENSDKLLEQLEASLDNRTDSREYLTARLLDFLTGDTDRGEDQWRWARFDSAGLKTFRPIPHDHDYAFMRAEGLIARLTATLYPKQASFGRSPISLRSALFTTVDFDRSQLVDLSWPAWDSVVARIRAALPDSAMDGALRALPPEHYATSGAQMLQALRARRDALEATAREYYRWINRQVDVFASDEPDVAEVDRHADGSVSVALYSRTGAPGRSHAAFLRRFLPDETDEIRLYMQGGDDSVIVRGVADHSIPIRVTGGAGNDVLIDSSRAAHHGAITFYDATGRNSVIRGPGTHVNALKFVTPQPVEDSVYRAHRDTTLREERRGRFQDMMWLQNGSIQSSTVATISRTWGETASLAPTLDYREGFGPIVGASYGMTDYGFRHDPFRSRLTFAAGYGIGEGGGGAARITDVIRAENSPMTFVIDAEVTQLEPNRFYGYGNDSPDLVDAVSFVRHTDIVFNPKVRWDIASKAWLSAGAIARHITTERNARSPASLLPDALTRFGEAGVELATAIDRRDSAANPHSGFSIDGRGTFFPATWDIASPYATVQGHAATYVPLGRATIALRIGGTRVFGDLFPLQDAAFIGGEMTLRGYDWNRFEGDAEAHGSAELRVSLARVALLARGTLGAFVFDDVARVWLKGASPSGWHSGVGGGLSFATLGAAVSLAYARGDATRFYLTYGWPF